MKKMVSMACMGLTFLLLACGTQKQKAESQAPTVVQDGIRFCESTYPYDGGILIITELAGCTPLDVLPYSFYMFALIIATCVSTLVAVAFCKIMQRGEGKGRAT